MLHMHRSPGSLHHSDQNISVLLAEDNLLNQELVIEFLAEEAYTVTVAGNGVEAVEAFKHQRFGVILMDCQMPVMDGYSATQSIRAIESAQNMPRTPIIAVTANAIRGDRETCLKSGMDDYLSKPFEPDELIALLEKWSSAKVGPALSGG